MIILWINPGGKLGIYVCVWVPVGKMKAASAMRHAVSHWNFHDLILFLVTRVPVLVTEAKAQNIWYVPISSEMYRTVSRVSKCNFVVI